MELNSVSNNMVDFQVQKAEEKKKEEEQREQKRLQSLSDREKVQLLGEGIRGYSSGGSWGGGETGARGKTTPEEGGEGVGEKGEGRKTTLFLPTSLPLRRRFILPPQFPLRPTIRP